MDLEQILERVIELAREQFPNAGTDLGAESTASQVASWNSLSHVMLVTAIEKEFGVKFDLLQMIGMKSLGDISRATLEALK